MTTKRNPSPPSRPRESIQSAAARLGVNPKTIRRRIQDGTITGWKVGRVIRVDPDEVERKLFRKIPTSGGDAA